MVAFGGLKDDKLLYRVTLILSNFIIFSQKYFPNFFIFLQEIKGYPNLCKIINFLQDQARMILKYLRNFSGFT